MVVKDHSLGHADGLWNMGSLSSGTLSADFLQIGFFFGLLAGALGAAINTSGLPVVIYVSLKVWTKDEVKSIAQGFFLMTLVLILGAYTAEGLITGAVLKDLVVCAHGAGRLLCRAHGMLAYQ